MPRKTTLIAAASLLTLASATNANAGTCGSDDSVTVIYAGGIGPDTRSCIFFQTQYCGATWFAIQYSDPGADFAKQILQQQQLTGNLNTSFTAPPGYTQCGLQGITGLSSGTIQ
jgi:hypothetical protein